MKRGIPRRRSLDLVSPLPLKVALSRMLRFLVVYSTALVISLWFSYELRFDFDMPREVSGNLFELLIGVVPLQLTFLYAFHQFHLLPAYFGIPALMRMSWAIACSGATLALIRWKFELGYMLPFGVVLLDALLSLVGLSCACYLWRLYRQDQLRRFFHGKKAANGFRRRVGIVGAGAAGASLALELQRDTHLGLEPVAFFDDDKTKWHARILEIPVLGPPDLLAKGIHRSYQIDEIILSMPSASAARVRAVLSILQHLGLPHRTVPSLGELAIGKCEVSQVRQVQIEDLLGREPVSLATEKIGALLQGRKVMVTGAGGSIGSELCRQVAMFEAAELLLVERCEGQLFAIEQELIRLGHAQVIRPLTADILDESRMRWIFTKYRPELVFHAAAHKHVPMMESQPQEAIQNNVFGTAGVAKLAMEFGAARFVLISTDKAINPTSVMGATKRLAEMLVQDLQARNHTSTKLAAVRFGNVLGSSGSVVPLFKAQIAAGGPVTVTHPEMTRYFMTIPEAVGLVLQSTVEANGGEIFVLDMGKPVRILELAKQMIQLSGMEDGRDIEIKFTGARPGEKLFEEISYTDESVTRTAHHKIMRVRGAPPKPLILQESLSALRKAVHVSPPQELKRLLSRAVPEYRQRDRQSQAFLIPEYQQFGTAPQLLAAIAPVTVE